MNQAAAKGCHAATIEASPFQRRFVDSLLADEIRLDILNKSD